VIHNGVGRIDAPTWKRNLVLSAGRLWDEAKNVTALAPVSQSFDWPIRLAGASQSDRNRADLGGRLELLGELPRPALLEQMRQSAVFVAPARYEPFGLSVLEAAACGCALVLSDIGTFRELWDGAALFVDPDDSDDIARTLATLRADPALRTRLQAAARRRADRYSAVAMQARYRELYRELSSSAGAANATALVGAAEARP
jgi:glycosyltransferase involved in cell wall biosynthesis